MSLFLNMLHLQSRCLGIPDPRVLALASQTCPLCVSQIPIPAGPSAPSHFPTSLLSTSRLDFPLGLLGYGFIFLDCRITVDGDCSHEIKRRLLFGRKVMTNPDSIFKSRDITLPTKVHLVKAMVFPAVMYGCESWTVKKAEL